MKKFNNISMFINKKDLIVNITNNKIINITGLSGSGKTTLANELVKNNQYVYVKLDWFFGYGHGKKNMPMNIKKIINKLINDYLELNDEKFFRWDNNRIKKIELEKRYKKYTPIFYDAIIKNIKEKMIIDGNQLIYYMNINKLKGTIIVKRTSLFTSYIHAFKRDMISSINEYKRKNIKFINVYKKFIERIVIHPSNLKSVNVFISKLIKKGKVVNE